MVKDSFVKNSRILNSKHFFFKFCLNIVKNLFGEMTQTVQENSVEIKATMTKTLSNDGQTYIYIYIYIYTHTHELQRS